LTETAPKPFFVPAFDEAIHMSRNVVGTGEYNRKRLYRRNIPKPTITRLKQLSKQ
jgi:hypothetical protein